MPRWGQSSAVFQLCIYHYTDVLPAVLNKIQNEDGLVYTKEITKIEKVNS